MRKFTRFFFIPVLLLILIACSTTKKSIKETEYIEVEVPVEVVKTEYKLEIKYDSIFVHDSIDRYVKGDTVHVYQLKNIYKYLYLRDTITKVDTIPVPYKVEKQVQVEVEKEKIVEVNKIKWYLKILMWLGVILLAAVSAFFIYNYVKLKLKK